MWYTEAAAAPAAIADSLISNYCIFLKLDPEDGDAQLLPMQLLWYLPLLLLLLQFLPLAMSLHLREPAVGRRVNSWLPQDKQFLVTRGVACNRRVRDIEASLNAEVRTRLGFWVSSVELEFVSVSAEMTSLEFAGIFHGRQKGKERVCATDKTFWI